VHRLHQRQEGHVKAQHLVFGVVDDPGNLVRVQAGVDGVQHAARATHAKVHLHVAVAIPGQGRHTVAELQLLGIQCVGQLAGAGRQVAVGVTVDIAFHPARDDFCITVVALGKLDQRRNKQRLALHQTQHVGS